MKRIIFVLALALASSFSDVVARVIDFEVCITDPTENHEPKTMNHFRKVPF